MAAGGCGFMGGVDPDAAGAAGVGTIGQSPLRTDDGASSLASASPYTAELVHFDTRPVVSFADGSAAFQQVFNPAWVQASAGTGGKAGLLIRTQNCTAKAGQCTHCNFGPCQDLGKPGVPPGDWAAHQCQDVITFAELLNDDNGTASGAPPRFKFVDSSSVVMRPHDISDDRGVQDPRVAFDPQTQTYYMFYTCYNSRHFLNASDAILCLATSKNPTSPTAWEHRGPVFLGASKSGALLIRESGPHYLIWGAGTIFITESNNLTSWTAEPSKTFITETGFLGVGEQNDGVESGPPPMKLSNGHYIFFHNSWQRNATRYANAGYQPAWVVLNGSHPPDIIARAPRPLWIPQRAAWMAGLPYDGHYTCNVRNVAFLEAAHPTENADEFRVYFGGSDTVIGSAVVKIQVPSKTDDS